MASLSHQCGSCECCRSANQDCNFWLQALRFQRMLSFSAAVDDGDDASFRAQGCQRGACFEDPHHLLSLSSAPLRHCHQKFTSPANIVTIIILRAVNSLLFIDFQLHQAISASSYRTRASCPNRKRSTLTLFGC